MESGEWKGASTAADEVGASASFVLGEFPMFTENEAGRTVLVLGTELHTAVLRAIAGEGEVSHPCTAVLRCDPKAAPDFSVRVLINDEYVGYLGATDRAHYMESLGTDVRSCRAFIMGQESEPWRLDVCLDLHF